MRYILILLALIPVSSYAVKQTDYACVADCSGKGYQYNYCQSICSFDTSQNNVYQSNQNTIKQTDYQCVSDCTNKGYQYNYCTSRCSF